MLRFLCFIVLLFIGQVPTVYIVLVLEKLRSKTFNVTGRNVQAFKFLNGDFFSSTLHLFPLFYTIFTCVDPIWIPIWIRIRIHNTGLLIHSFFYPWQEHSRSAADQDVPLSHELRPSRILKMTMDYLMCNIVDRIGELVLPSLNFGNY